MWVCKECGQEVVRIEIINTTKTNEITRNNKKGKLKTSETKTTDIGYICNSIFCKNNKEYSKSLEEIACWEED